MMRNIVPDGFGEYLLGVAVGVMFFIALKYFGIL